MTKPKPPFATVEVDDSSDNSYRLLFNGQQAGLFWYGDDEVRAIADAANGAAEAREANLVSVLRGLLTAYDVRRAPKGAVDFATDGVGAGAAWSAALAALEGTGPDLVAELRAQVEALRAEKGPWMILADLAQTGGLASERAAAIMAALGLPPPKPVLAEVSDAALDAEVKRRDALEKVEHIFETHEYGYRDGRTTITGRSYCGMALGYGGRWTAVTPDEAMRQGPRYRSCGECRVRFGPWQSTEPENPHDHHG